ncbi:MAG TPA: hypothetical protein VFS62_04035 [Chloroflexota bacterium]|jgi:hypothetical protein|nr:hypothetical protein [Chloroflexota bacterium]
MTRSARSRAVPGLTPEDHALLRDVPTTASLVDEISYLRERVRAVMAGASDQALESKELRMLELLTRMVSVQAKIGGHDGGTDLADLNELVRQRLVKAGWQPN